MHRRLFAATAPLLLALWARQGHGALHLMFPYDYLALGDEQRRIYVMGVVDASLAPFTETPRLEWLTRCLVTNGVGRVRAVLETRVIPGPESAVIPMPYLVERALVEVCGSAPVKEP